VHFGSRAPDQAGGVILRGDSREAAGMSVILLAGFSDLLHTSRGVIPGLSTGVERKKGRKRACLAPIGALR
jgi:hypothetical protein